MHAIISLFPRHAHRSITIGTIICIGLILGGCPSPDLPIPSTIDPAQDGADPATADEEEQVLAYTGIYPLADPRGGPSNLNVTRLAERRIRLGWQDNSADEEGFRIERRDDGGSWQPLGTVGRNQTSYIDESIEGNKSYEYRIIAFNINDESTPSTAVSLISETETQEPSSTLLPIIDLQIQQVAESSIQLTWSDVNDQEEGTLIERSDDANGWGKRVVLGPNLATYVDMDLQVGMTYCYRVTPFREKENASVSESVCLMLEGAADSTAASGGGGGGGAGAGEGSPPPPRPPFLVVEDGQAVACIVVPDGCWEMRRPLAIRLNSYLQQAMNTQLDIVRQQDTRPAIHLGRSDYVDQLGLDLDNLGEQGFVLFGVDENNFIIAGQTDKGTEFGVYEFLERYLGVRWLMPGEYGTDVPSRNRLEVPAEEVRQKPAFFFRRISGLSSQTQWLWASRNRMYADISFHHNMHNLFPPSRYTSSHPEFYPTINGQLYLPSSDSDQAWQPNFVAPSIVSEAAANIIDFFQANPDTRSYSLGINDSRFFDDALFQASSGVNTLGSPDLSNPYYAFCNQVAEQVVQVFPQKYFGCLAYINVIDPPTGFTLHPNIIPFVTYDRMKWFSPPYLAQGRDTTRRWAAAANLVGWYDYIYGSAYCMPRVYPNLMKDYLQFGHTHGVQAIYAEAYPFWGEGPKLYTYLKLLWNPYQDVDTLLNDWYDRCVGKEAAPYLREYYAIWERFWTVTAPTTNWFHSSGLYLGFSRADYLAAIDEADVIRSRELLNDCVAHTQTSTQQVRAELLRRAFEYYEASYDAYRPEAIAKYKTIATESEALSAVAALRDGLHANIRRFQLWNAFQNDEVLRPGMLIDDRQELTGDTWGFCLPWRLFDYAQTDPNVKTALEDLMFAAPTVLALNLHNLLKFVDNPIISCSTNGSFETPSLTPWRTWTREDGLSTHPQYIRTSEVSYTGMHSLMINGIANGSVYQEVTPSSGPHLAVMHYYTPPREARDGIVTIRIMVSANNEWIWQNTSAETYLAAGAWNTLCHYVDVPETIQGHPVEKIRIMVNLNNVNPDSAIYVDDITLYKLPE